MTGHDLAVAALSAHPTSTPPTPTTPAPVAPAPVSPAPSPSTVQAAATPNLDDATLPATVTRATASGGTELLHLVVPAAFGCAFAVVLLTWFLRSRRRRRRRSPRLRFRRLRIAGGSAFALLLLVLTLASAVNLYAGYLPNLASAGRFLTGDDSAHVVNDQTTRQALSTLPEAPAAVAAGDTKWTVHDETLPDPALRIGSRKVIVATPPGYASSGRIYPVLYTFPGYYGRPADWFETGRVTSVIDALVARRLAPYFIVVSPDVNGGYTTDSETLDAVGGAQVETWVTRDLTAWVERSYRARPDRGSRVVAGMSSGGFAALNVTLRNQDVFGIALALEPFGDPGNVTDRLLGGSKELLHQNSPSYYLPRTEMHRKISVYFDVGATTGDVGKVSDMARLLTVRGQDAELRLEQGQGHTWSEAVAGLPHALAFAGSRVSDPSYETAYPASAFPTTNRDRYSLLIGPDAGRQRLELDQCVEQRKHVPPGGPPPQACVLLFGPFGAPSPKPGPSPTG